ncbi:unnamed protein product [Hymenolepis diminuta]|uniref:F-box/kelch-repeat protein n=1 Tax=Hymenolepis diminuta TaxID=6216 RepID=A0A0R3SXE8_HYMDI|nr:unnamed protein product [Hymenolepis diminuta]
MVLDSPGVYSSEVYEASSRRRKKTVCCSQHSKLQRVSGGGEKWQWRSFSPMNEEHGGELLAAYLQGRVYVVGYGEYVDTMEMLDVAADGQWSSLTSSSWSLYQPLPVGSVTSVDHQLFLSVIRGCANLPDFNHVKLTRLLQEGKFSILHRISAIVVCEFNAAPKQSKLTKNS